MLTDLAIASFMPIGPTSDLSSLGTTSLLVLTQGLPQVDTGLGYGILYNTGREDRIRRRTLALLHRDGLPVDGLCMRRSGENLVHSKQRCRDEYARSGWTLVENIGNNPTDLAGDGYELGIMLPNYGGRLA